MNRIKCTGTNISSVLVTVQFNLETRVEEERNARRWHSLHLQLTRSVCLCQYLEVVQQSPSSTVYVCSCPCLEVAQRYSNNLHLELCMCAHVHAYLHLETCSCQCLEVA